MNILYICFLLYVPCVEFIYDCTTSVVVRTQGLDVTCASSEEFHTYTPYWECRQVISRCVYLKEMRQGIRSAFQWWLIHKGCRPT